MARYLITGINGFIGSHMARKLLTEGHRVRGLVRKTSKLGLIENLDIELVFGDVREPVTLPAALRNIERVIHIAGKAADWGPYRDFYQANCQGTRHLAEEAEKAAVERFVDISTAALHGFGQHHFDENSPLAPDQKLNAYSISKKRAEEWLQEFSRTSRMGITVVRPGNVYGPDDHTFIDKYLLALYSGKIAYVNKGRALTCPVYIDNLVDAVYLASFKEQAAGEVFLISDGLEITWREFTERLAEALGVSQPRLSIPFGLGYCLGSLLEAVYLLLRIKAAPLVTRYRVSNGGLDYHFSIAKANRLLDYQPQVGIDEAIEATAAWFRREFFPGKK